jgi:hypothetical protein
MVSNNKFMNCLHGCWTVDFVMVNFYHFVKTILEKEYCYTNSLFFGKKRENKITNIFLKKKNFQKIP